MARRNTVANFLGMAWSTLMNLAFIPFYIHYLGIEAYGLVALLIILQTWLGLADLGMSSMLSREMARGQAGAHSIDSLRDLLRTVEFLQIAISLAVVTVVALVAPWLGRVWLDTSALPATAISQGLVAMAVIVVLRLLEGIYRGCLLGLGRHVALNAALAAVATLRGLGAVAVLHFVSAAPIFFFLWQIVVSFISILLLAVLTYRSLPTTERSGQFSLESMWGVWRFALGLSAATIPIMLLGQLDKLLLSALLPLQDFAVYSLAAIVAGGLFALSASINTAIYPRLTALLAAGDAKGAVRIFHRSAQAVTAVTGAAALALIALGEPFLALWTQDATLATRAAPLLQLLALANLLIASLQSPYYAQLAHGRTRSILYLNLGMVTVAAPLLYAVAPLGGASAAAMVWAASNAVYLLVGACLMFRTVFAAEAGRWLYSDLLAPLLPATLVAMAAAYLFPEAAPAWLRLAYLATAAATIVLAALSLTSFSPVRRWLLRHGPSRQPDFAPIDETAVDPSRSRS
jgi:O-antigen/teichoic acid export membrane protein